MLRILSIAALTLAVVAAARAADEAPPPKNSPRRAEHYYVAAGKTYNMHAHDHARMLGKFAAASDRPVPRAVIQEHAAAIGKNVELARASYARLAEATRATQARKGATASPNATLQAQLAEVEKRLGQVSQQVARLQAASAGEAAESKMIVDETAAITSNLKATHAASKEIDAALTEQAQANDAFDDIDSASYYSTGEGHFID